MRLLDLVCAAGLLGLAALKWPDSVPTDAVASLVLVAAALEGALAACFALGRIPRCSALMLTALGAGSCAWALLAETGPWWSASRCGCFGSVTVTRLQHLLAASGLLFLGGLRCTMLARRRAPVHPAEPARGLETPA